MYQHIKYNTNKYCFEILPLQRCGWRFRACAMCATLCWQATVAITPLFVVFPFVCEDCIWNDLQFRICEIRAAIPFICAERWKQLIFIIKSVKCMEKTLRMIVSWPDHLARTRLISFYIVLICQPMTTTCSCILRNITMVASPPRTWCVKTTLLQ